MLQCTHSWQLSPPKDGVVTGECVKCKAVGEWRDGTAKVLPPRDGFKLFGATIIALLKDMRQERDNLNARLRELEPQLDTMARVVKALEVKPPKKAARRQWTPEQREAQRQRLRRMREDRKAVQDG